MAIYLPDPPIKGDNYFVLIAVGLAIGLVSEIIEYYFLADMDTPTTRVYDNVQLELDPESVINNEEKEDDSTGVGAEAPEKSEGGSLDDGSGDSGSTV